MPEAGISPNVSLWMFDFDGTLSLLVADRTAARLESTCRDMLHQLAAVRGFHCAVISSRLLSDLEDRVDVSGIFLGGGSGLEWRLPDGRLQVPGADRMDAIRKVRKTLMTEIMEWGRLPGVEIEDKQWSVAIHIRQATQQTQRKLSTFIDCWQQARKVSVFRGPEVLEVQLLPEVDKSMGVRAFCDLVNCTPAAGRLVYAGDDENDAMAMQLVRDWGGTIITVGEKAIVPGSDVVSSPMELAKRISILATFVDGEKIRKRGC
jgi:trehalose 6-phosphate phosphatase